LESKLTRANSDLEQASLASKGIERDLTEVRLRLEGSQAMLEGLTSEKTHLELSLREANDQRV